MAYDIFNTIYIDGVGDLPRPNDFTLERENILAAEVTTCTGKKYADLIGWRYSDLTLTFDSMPESTLTWLLQQTGRGTTIRGRDERGNQFTEHVILEKSSSQATRETVDGKAVWKNVQIAIRFMDVHSYS